MEQLLDRSSTYEQGLEGSERLSRDRVVYLGNLAIRWEVLGINDPLTHLFQYLERAEEALVGIEEDLVTDIAERLPKTPFVNLVQYEVAGNDFVSVKEKASMRSMTTNTAQIFAVDSIYDPGLSDEYARAQLEAQEADKLTNWFRGASVGAFLVFESLPIGKQTKAISRIFRKNSEAEIEGSFVSLYNPTIEQFNSLRNELVPGLPVHETELEILSNQYEFYDTGISSSEEFVVSYVGIFDHLLSEQDGQHRSFGIVTEGDGRLENGLEKIRMQPELTSVYLDVIKVFAESAGRVNSDVLKLNRDLGINFDLVPDQRLTLCLVHDFLERAIVGITSVIDRADFSVLDAIESSGAGGGGSYDAVSSYGGEAQASGETYSNTGCPTHNRGSANEAANANGSEKKKMSSAYSNPGDPEDFGIPKQGVCIIPGCPSHGKNKYIHDRVRVGGCGICRDCHLIFLAKKSPAAVYAEERRKAENKQVAAERVVQIEAEDKRTREEEQRRIWNAKKQKMKILAEQKRTPYRSKLDIWAKKAA